MRRPSLFLLSTCAAIGGCDFDPVEFSLDVPSSPCIEPEERRTIETTVSGSVRDHVTGQPIVGADVAVNTAWDIPARFPADCPPLATFTTSGDGRFGEQTIDVGSRIDPPIAIFLVTGAGLADTASDQTLACVRRDCDDLDHTIAAPTRALVASWRQELEEGGMPDASTRGLVLFEFAETDGSPASGVSPMVVEQELRALAPGIEVRFLEPDRSTLAPPETAATTASGVALIGGDPDSVISFVFGEREGYRWPLTGVLAPPGWIFLEQRWLVDDQASASDEIAPAPR